MQYSELTVRMPEENIFRCRHRECCAYIRAPYFGKFIEWKVGPQMRRVDS